MEIKMNTIQDLLKTLLESPNDVMSIASMGSAPVETKTDFSNIEQIDENEEIKLSGKSMRTLFVAHIAEQLVNEEVEADDDLSKQGLMLEGKLTLKGKDWIKKYLPTIYAS
jgi:hypothetical protein